MGVKMDIETTFPNAVILSVIDRTKNYLANEVGIDVMQVSSAAGELDRLDLKEFTAIIGIGGSIGLLIAFSFPRDFADILCGRLTTGFNVTPDEIAPYRRSTVTEVANVIVGNCTADFTDFGERICMSPPVLLEETKYIHRMENAAFYSISIVTAQGTFDINLVGPWDMFNTRLEYVNEVRSWNA